MIKEENFMVTKHYILTEEEAKSLISDLWPKASPYASKQLNIVNERIAILQKALSEKQPLSIEKFYESCLDDRYFKTVRKALNPYTHILKGFIEQTEADFDNMSISENVFSQLKDIHRSAILWYKEFNKAVSEYRDTEQMYRIAYIYKYGVISFIPKETP